MTLRKQLNGARIFIKKYDSARKSVIETVGFCSRNTVYVGNGKARAGIEKKDLRVSMKRGLKLLSCMDE
jgi:hypothetical protein